MINGKKTLFAEYFCTKDTTQCAKFLFDVLFQDTKQQCMQQLQRIRLELKQQELVSNIIIITEAPENT